MPTQRQLPRRLASLATLACVSAIATCGAALALTPTASAGTLRLKVCGRWSQDQGPFRAHTPSPFGWDVQCGSQELGLELWSILRKSAPHGATARWLTTAPRGIMINHASVVGPRSRSIGDGRGWAGRFFWDGGHVAVTGTYNRRGCCRRRFRSRSLGWRMTCVSRSCDRAATIDVGGIELLATENRAPTIDPSGMTNLWFNAGQWVRGTWPVAFNASDPSGVCHIAAALGDESVPGPSETPDTDYWHQCRDRDLTVHVDTTNARGAGGSRQGAMTLRLSAANAARVDRSRTETIYVDNTQPWVRISGRTDASSTDGTQYLTATAGGSPSGIAGITCRVDHGAARSYPGSSARVPVAGVGPHTIVCTAENRAVNPAGKRAVSQPATWKLTIRRPTAITALFSRVVPRHVVTVWVREHGHWVRRQAIIPAHTVYRHTRRIPFGARTAIGGRLTVEGGRGLGDQTVRLLSAPDNRSKHYTQVATVRTRASGRWRATLQAGPSRLIKATYAGSSTDEPATSPRAKVIVPAKVDVRRLWPRRVGWGGTVHIDGFLAGGYLPPPPAGELVRLRLGYGRAYTTYGVKTDVTGRGRFKVSFRFGSGPASVVRHYWFEECSLPADDYPYAPSCSRKITVRVGG